jgi:hypothetical protein
MGKEADCMGEEADCMGEEADCMGEEAPGCRGIIQGAGDQVQ